MKEIWFDMDGTIADLYGVENWLPKLEASDPSPYREAKPLVNMQVLARTLNRLRDNGYKLGIISWTSKRGTPTYNEAVATTKREWLKKHLKSVIFDRIDIVEYGTPKENGRNGYLFDDEEKNRKNWKGIAFTAENLLENLRAL